MRAHSWRWAGDEIIVTQREGEWWRGYIDTTTRRAGVAAKTPWQAVHVTSGEGLLFPQNYVREGVSALWMTVWMCSSACPWL